MFTTGRLVFTLCFFVAFVIMMAWAYRKDLKINQLHFSNNYRIILGIVLIFSLLFLIIKIKSWYFK